jgi:hypothetical protein
MQLFIRHKYIKISPSHRQKDFHAQYLKKNSNRQIFQYSKSTKI